MIVLTSFFWRFSSGVSSGSFGAAASSSLTFGVSFLVFGLEVFLLDSFPVCGVAVPLVVFGVVVNLMVVFGFLTESSRCGVCHS